MRNSLLRAALAALLAGAPSPVLAAPVPGGVGVPHLPPLPPPVPPPLPPLPPVLPTLPPVPPPVPPVLPTLPPVPSPLPSVPSVPLPTVPPVATLPAPSVPPVPTLPAASSLPTPSVPDLSNGSPVGGVGNSLLPKIPLAVDSIGRPVDQRVIVLNSVGQKIVRGEVIAVSPTAADLAIAHDLNFSIGKREDLSALGVDAVSLFAPPGMDSVVALSTLRKADPTGTFDFDHIYDPSGSVDTAALQPAVRKDVRAAGRAVLVGMIDAGIDTHHRSLARDEIVTTNVTGNGKAFVTAHGTAVASLLVGVDNGFHGELPGAKLFAADAFGADATGGSALDIARALDWLAQKGVVVVNASFAGPPNALLGAAVRSFIASGHVLVAAAGNAGPAAPLAYPAAYEGVIGVTSVDSQHRLQLDANRGNVSFAALGVDVRAATVNGGYATYTGTSFAAPVVTAHFATLVVSPDSAAARVARETLARGAEHLGDSAAYGFGYVPPLSPSVN